MAVLVGGEDINEAVVGALIVLAMISGLVWVSQSSFSAVVRGPFHMFNRRKVEKIYLSVDFYSEKMLLPPSG